MLFYRRRGVAQPGSATCHGVQGAPGSNPGAPTIAHTAAVNQSVNSFSFANHPC